MLYEEVDDITFSQVGRPIRYEMTGAGHFRGNFSISALDDDLDSPLIRRTKRAKLVDPALNTGCYLDEDIGVELDI